jgi:hypothetical protein
VAGGAGDGDDGGGAGSSARATRSEVVHARRATAAMHERVFMTAPAPPRCALRLSPLRRAFSRPMAKDRRSRREMSTRLSVANTRVESAARLPAQTTRAVSASPARTTTVSTTVLPTYFSTRELTRKSACRAVFCSEYSSELSPTFATGKWTGSGRPGRSRTRGTQPPAEQERGAHAEVLHDARDRKELKHHPRDVDPLEILGLEGGHEGRRVDSVALGLGQTRQERPVEQVVAVAADPVEQQREPCDEKQVLVARQDADA